MEALAHPITLSIPQEQLQLDYIKLTCNQVPDPKWHFETVVHKSTRIGPPGTTPQPGLDVQRLSIFNRMDPPCDIEFFGTHLLYDVNPADWLDLWLEQQPHVTVLSRRRFPNIGGSIGDVLAKWDVEGMPWVGRFFVTKVGPRVFLMWSRVMEADYPRMAEPIFLAIMSFRLLDTSAGPLAEGVRWVNGKAPVAWKLALPASWEGQVQPGNEQAAAFEAVLVRPAGGSERGAGAAGSGGAQGGNGGGLAKVSFAIVAPGVVPGGRELGAMALEAVRASGVVLASTAFADEAAAAPYTAAWYLETQGTLNGTPVAVHARVLQHPSAWVAAVVVGPARQVQPALWMQARRLLDIVTMTLVIG
jgi:hypothetical protein